MHAESLSHWKIFLKSLKLRSISPLYVKPLQHLNEPFALDWHPHDSLVGFVSPGQSYFSLFWGSGTESRQTYVWTHDTSVSVAINIKAWLVYVSEWDTVNVSLSLSYR